MKLQVRTRFFVLAAFMATAGCAADVNSGDMASTSPPVASKERFNGTYRTCRGSFIDEMLPSLPRNSDSFRISIASDMSVTVTCFADGKVTGSVFRPARFQNGYLFFVTNGDDFDYHGLSKMYEDTAAGVGIDSDGNLHWRSDQRDVVLLLGFLPCQWSHLRCRGDAVRVPG